ncbi:pyridoxal phosphate-dependent aminotransferase [Hymenobacter cellulosilyticus]|uniref:Aminotransferase class I/II-fold pyridoxal phosphate-dependent enzyme n=1 Tax=Hymenobacter cellulosilyticus TaxID=2932248 RepID=A0A8T9Q8M6_9BACT|nr:aminotransferase class I/II-fold pyridoxal phosphate-dependent enzyme [Hymenobacter cellulosilyticus]UOQ71363.1 aminotransferase class I/II-fold pyridoxal phosphate-dependent enzyme [Hymenobacter cellulosilyticus]
MMVSKMAGSLIGSEIIKIGNEVNDMIRKGEEICNLTIGDFDPKIYPIPEGLQTEISAAYSAGHTNYPPANGMADLRTAVAQFTTERLGLTYSVNDILVAGGSRPLIYATYLALIDAGDKVVFPVPSWNNNHYCHLSGAEPIMVETTVKNNFMPTAAEVAPHLKGATLLALCSPLNPTGTVFSKQDLEDICDLVIAENKTRAEGEKPLYIMYDQIYWMLTFGETQHYDPVNLRPELRDYVIYIDGISKCFAATGVRVGYAFGPSNVIDKMKSILGHVGAWAPKAEQVATAKYLQQGEAVNEFLTSFKVKVQRSLDTLYNGLQDLKKQGYPVDAVVPQGAIYLTAQINAIGKTTPEGKLLATNKDITFYLISRARLAVVPFGAFGTDETSTWFRMSVGGASLESMEAALPRLQEALDALQ